MDVFECLELAAEIHQPEAIGLSRGLRVQGVGLGLGV